MASYAIGDIHGCYRSLRALLAEAGFRAGEDRVWLVGDLVNRGPASLAVLRWASDLGERAVAVLGNHDLHLVARAEGLAEARGRDTLDEVLAADDGPQLIDWLRSRPLFHREGPWAMVHAGLLPAWSLADAEQLAGEVGAALAGGDGDRLLSEVRQPSYPAWSAALQGFQRQRLALAAFVLLRTLAADGSLFPRFAGPPAEAPEGCRPWFAVPHHRETGATLLFGHWAALGLYRAPGLVGLDSGCAWGGELTALRLDDGRFFQVPNQDGSPRR